MLGIEEFSSFIKNDKEDGVKHAYYFYHADAGINALDSSELFDMQCDNYYRQGFEFYGSKTCDKNICDRFGVKSIQIIIFKMTNGVKNINFPIDLSLFCGYMKADDEITILNINF